MYSYGPPHMAVQKQDDQLELTYSNYVRTQDVTLKTCRRRWVIGRSGERGSGISVLAARQDDDDTRICFSVHVTHSCVIFPWFALLSRQKLHDRSLFKQWRTLFDLLPFWVASKHIYTIFTHPGWAGYGTRSIFKRRLKGLNSELFFS